MHRLRSAAGGRPLLPTITGRPDPLRGGLRPHQHLGERIGPGHFVKDEPVVARPDAYRLNAVQDFVDGAG